MERRRIVVGAAVALTLLRLSIVNGLHAQDVAQDAAGFPRIECAAPVHNFGRVIEGSLVVHEFALANVGTVPLAVHRVVAACGCTTAGALSEPILPSEEGLLRVVFDSSGFSGQVSKSVRVYTSDISRPFLTLTLEGEVLPEVSVLPPWVSFPELVRSPDAPLSSQEVEIQIAAGSDLKLGLVKNFSPSLKVDEIKGGDKQRRLKVSINPEAPLGELRERVTIDVLGGPKGRSQINIPIYAQVVPSLKLEPKILSFGLLSGQAEVTRTARLISLTGKPVAIKGYRSSYADMDVSIKAEQDGGSHVISVRLDPKRVKENLYAAVELTTDRQGEEHPALQVQAVIPSQ